MPETKLDVARHDATAQHVGGATEQEERDHEQHAGTARAEENQERPRRSSENATRPEPDLEREPALRLLAVAMTAAAEETEPEPYTISSDSNQTEYFTRNPSPTERALQPAGVGNILHQEDSSAAGLQDEGMDLGIQMPAGQAAQISRPLESEPSVAAADADSEYDADRSSLSSSDCSFDLAENDSGRRPGHWQWVSDAPIDRGLPLGPDTAAAALPPALLEASQEIAAVLASLPPTLLEASQEIAAGPAALPPTPMEASPEPAEAAAAALPSIPLEAS
ncbi:hypothetical protein ABEF93_005967 [Exophiala dermatitidis]